MTQEFSNDRCRPGGFWRVRGAVRICQPERSQQGLLAILLSSGSGSREVGFLIAPPNQATSAFGRQHLSIPCFSYSCSARALLPTEHSLAHNYRRYQCDPWLSRAWLGARCQRQNYRASAISRKRRCRDHRNNNSPRPSDCSSAASSFAKRSQVDVQKRHELYAVCLKVHLPSTHKITSFLDEGRHDKCPSLYRTRNGRGTFDLRTWKLRSGDHIRHQSDQSLGKA